MMMRMIYEVKKFSVIEHEEIGLPKNDDVEPSFEDEDEDDSMTIDGMPFAHPY